MSKSYSFNLSFILIIAIFCISLISCGKSNSSVLSAEDFAKEFSSNRIAASKKYNGKTITLEGEIRWMDQQNVDILIDLKTSNEMFITLIFKEYDEQGKKTLELKKGQEIKVTGTVDYIPGYGTGIKLTSVKILN